MSKKSIDGIIKGAFCLGVGTFIAKLIGAIYRIPLTNLIGGYGLGLYQMVFPVYTLLLDFSSAGVPNALSKIISGQKYHKEYHAYNYLKTSIKVLSILGIIFSSVMFLGGKFFANFQGDDKAFLGYVFLSPAIFFVCIISSFRGYFQGLLNMKPTAISQVLEQVIKLVVGLLFAYIFINKVIYQVAGITFAITLSEIVATLFLYFVYKKRNSKLNLKL